MTRLSDDSGALDVLLAQIELEPIETSNDPTFVFDDTLTIVYLNEASRRFARGNGSGDDDRTMQVGASLRAVFPEPLRAFYQELFDRVRTTKVPVTHDYDCSSPSRYRLYRMQIMPLRGGYLVTHSLRVEHPHTWPSNRFSQEAYRNPEGLILQCSHCRRTRRAGHERWDWVPELLERGTTERVSDGLCPACYAFHYRPDAIETR